MPLSENSVLQRFLVRRGGGLHHVAYAVSDVRSASTILRHCGVRVLYDAPRAGTAARRSTLSTPRTLAAFCSSWSSTPRRIRTVSSQVGAERMAVAHAGTDSASIPIFGEGFLR